MNQIRTVTNCRAPQQVRLGLIKRSSSVPSKKIRDLVLCFNSIQILAKNNTTHLLVGCISHENFTQNVDRLRAATYDF